MPHPWAGRGASRCRTRAVPAGRQHDLVALLALEAGRAVSAARLVDALWPERPPANPDNALQQRIHHLRRLLGPDADRRLVTVPGGYLLDVSPADVDAHRFERLATDGHRALEVGDATTASALLARADALWRGPALEGIEAAWAEAEARRLGERRLAAREDRIDADLALGRHAELVAELEVLVVAEPLRERARGQLMIALAGSGRQAEALTVYDEGRRRLAEELGIDPSPALQHIHADVLSQRVQPPRPASRHGSSWRQRPLPALATSFVGRQEEVRRLRDLVSGERLVTLTGPGGAGKTRLAVEVAGALLEAAGPRVHLVELASLREPDAVEGHVAASVDVATTDLPPREALRSALGAADSLLVLDNCEHLVTAVGDLVEDLLASCPALTVLATSRESLGVAGEVIWPVGPLPVPPEDTRRWEDADGWAAFRLFVDRAAEVAPELELGDTETPDITRIVRRLDGIPLAIELAAARLRVLSVAEIAERLHDRFGLLTGGHRSAPDRHRALSATLEWSWSLLGPDEQRAWMAASVPVGPFPASLLEPLLAAAGAELEVLDALTALTDRSLLTVHQRGHPTRYRMLETLREFGAAELAASGQESQVRAEHARTVERALADTDHSDGATWNVDLEAQRAWLPEARSAMRWGHDQGNRRGVQRLAAGLGWLWYLTALAPEGMRWLDDALGSLGELDPDDTEPGAVFWAACLRVNEAPEDHGLRWAQLAVDLATDDTWAALARAVVATHRAVAGNLDAAHAAIDAEPAHDGWVEGYWRLLEGQLHALAGRPHQARPLLARAEHLLIDNGAWFGIWASEALVQLAALRGDVDEVRRVAARSLELCGQHEAPELEVELRCALGMVEAAVGEQTRADHHLEVAAAIVDRTGVVMSRALVAMAHGYVAWRRGALDAAADALQDAAALHDRAAQHFGRFFALWCLAHVTLRRGDAVGASRLFAESLTTAVVGGDGDGIACAIEGLAAACCAEGRDGPAARLLGIAGARRVRMDATDPLLSRDEVTATELLLRDRLAPEVLAAERAAGGTIEIASEADAAALLVELELDGMPRPAG